MFRWLKRRRAPRTSASDERRRRTRRGYEPGEAGTDGTRSNDGLGESEKLGIGSGDGVGKRRLGRPTKDNTKMSRNSATTISTQGRAS
jgi:hypothetical protein